MAEREQIAELLASVGAILREEGAAEVYVFGSFARGDVRPDSDIDLAVVGLASDRIIPAMGRVREVTGRMADILQVEGQHAFVRYLRSTGELRRVA